MDLGEFIELIPSASYLDVYVHSRKSKSSRDVRRRVISLGQAGRILYASRQHRAGNPAYAYGYEDRLALPVVALDYVCGVYVIEVTEGGAS